jgi:hypothetical protein
LKNALHHLHKLLPAEEDRYSASDAILATYLYDRNARTSFMVKAVSAPKESTLLYPASASCKTGLIVRILVRGSHYAVLAIHLTKREEE